jgi:hypothetical protein
MLLGFQKIVEERIREAIDRGDFDRLDGMGKPLEKEDHSTVAPELRLAYKIMKNANLLPPEMQTLKEIERLEALLTGIDDENEKYRCIRRMNSLVTEFNLMRNTSVSLEKKQYYIDKLSTRFNRS